jgi:hypothetical protein
MRTLVSRVSIALTRAVAAPLLLEPAGVGLRFEMASETELRGISIVRDHI